VELTMDREFAELIDRLGPEPTDHSAGGSDGTPSPTGMVIESLLPGSENAFLLPTVQTRRDTPAEPIPEETC
jgi:hypothetical protein